MLICLFIYFFGQYFSHSELSLAKSWAERTQADAGLEGVGLEQRPGAQRQEGQKSDFNISFVMVVFPELTQSSLPVLLLIIFA